MATVHQPRQQPPPLTIPVRCLLVGQPTLRRKIRLGVLAALDQRIVLRYTLHPMTPPETAGDSVAEFAQAARV